MSEVKFFKGEQFPLEFHKVRVVQKLNLVDIERRLEAMKEAKFNTFRLKTKDVFLDMLTDSGTNAMSDKQVAAMFEADDAYAGSQSFERLEKAINTVLGQKFILPVHQGRAAENIICKTFVRKGSVILTNYHFTTTLAHILENGGRLVELLCEGALEPNSDNQFKGNMNIEELKKQIQTVGKENIPFIRMEASTNLIGGQPFSLQNMREVKQIANENNIMFVLDASLLGENAFLIKQRECPDMSIKEILLEMCLMSDLLYFSARKLSSSRGGAICTNDKKIYNQMENLVPLYEGFLTYGGISIREIEAMAVGLMETTDETVVGQSPEFIRFMVNTLDQTGIPVIKPAGVLGCHVDAKQFCSHIPQTNYPAGALAAALFIISGVRGMERGTVSSVRDENGVEILADAELLRLALPRRVFTLSQVKYVIDRLQWLHANRELIEGLKFVEEPKVLRFFTGGLAPVNDWAERLVEKFKEDFGDSL